ncbi:MAG: hypothetical protein AUI42_00125 [Actinobacteria bacterium 13_1_40CM_2_65_8]|nr:MAG: hypothetical protein AUI42_00125 [Actinobacteria bacterium 13_1_40CM_2_65_8]
MVLELPAAAAVGLQPPAGEAGLLALAGRAAPGAGGNLAVNAVEAMRGTREGPRNLIIRTGAAESDGVLVAVRDSGPGLTPAGRERLFEAFYTTKPEGLGMGHRSAGRSSTLTVGPIAFWLLRIVPRRKR